MPLKPARNGILGTILYIFTFYSSFVVQLLVVVASGILLPQCCFLLSLKCVLFFTHLNTVFILYTVLVGLEVCEELPIRTRLGPLVAPPIKRKNKNNGSGSGNAGKRRKRSKP